MTKLHFVSLGCPKNLVDSEVMLGHLLEAGFSLVEDAACAEVIVVNTCAFIEDAKKEAIDTILEMGELKKEGACRLLIVAGCLPQRYEEDLAKLLPEVDIFIGAGEFPRIVDIISRWKGAQSLHVDTPTFLYDHESPRAHVTPRHVAYVKIAEGCFHACSFCIIPRIRGRFRSRAVDSVVAEARELVAAGVRELNIIAQDTTAYGRDIGADIALLMDRLAEIEGKKWLRLMYAYPHDFPLGLVGVMRDRPDICRYLDIPIQHVSDRILKSMRRKGGGAEVRSLVARLRRELPGLSLRTSVIVGYPGETQREFDELLDFICEARFDHLGVFTFSPEEGTAAAKLKNRVDPEIAQRRRDEAMSVQREISFGNNRRHLGKRIRVLVEGTSPESELLLVGRHEGQAPEIDGIVYINDLGDAAAMPVAGDFVEVEITEAHEYDIVGRVAGIL